MRSPEQLQADSSSESEQENTVTTEAVENPSTGTASNDDYCSNFDVGEWLGKSSSMTRPQKLDLLKKRWIPPKSYDFKKDASDLERSFIHDWLSTYEPWLCYSKTLKGALCIYCVMFPPAVAQGVLGAFIVTPFQRYKHMHESCRSHSINQWHKQAIKSAISFMDEVPVNVLAISGHQKLIQENRRIVASIIETIIFCGNHDLPLRGKQFRSGK